MELCFPLAVAKLLPAELHCKNTHTCIHKTVSTQTLHHLRYRHSNVLSTDNNREKEKMCDCFCADAGDNNQLDIASSVSPVSVRILLLGGGDSGNYTTVERLMVYRKNNLLPPAEAQILNRLPFNRHNKKCQCFTKLNIIFNAKNFRGKECRRFIVFGQLPT